MRTEGLGQRAEGRGRNGVRTTLWILALCTLPSALSAQRMQRYFGDPNEYYTPPAYHGNGC